MKNVSVNELKTNLLKYLKLAKSGERINVTSKGVVLATLTSPVSEQATARAKLRKLAETACIHDVISSTGEIWGTDQIRKYRGRLKWEGNLDSKRRD
jgi:antitoxin (DNA-binding transcriptional repressor) of toxin-antitoxin stability system